MKQTKKGFTLIELLIVIAIIGILSSVVLVSLSSAKNKALRASALATVSGLGSELIMCQDDSGTLNAPTSMTAGGANVCTASGHSVAWPSLAAGTTGYQYASSSVGAVLAGQTFAGGLHTFYLYNAGNALITCNYSSVANLQCI